MATNSRVVLDPDQLNDADEAILDALHDGRASPSYLSDRTGIEQTYINQRLRRLDEHGHVDNLARGLWELADDPRDDTVEVEPERDADELREELAEVKAANEQLEKRLAIARDESVDLEAARRALDDLEAACERGDGAGVQDALERLREVLDDA